MKRFGLVVGLVVSCSTQALALSCAEFTTQIKKEDAALDLIIPQDASHEQVCEGRRRKIPALKILRNYSPSWLTKCHVIQDEGTYRITHLGDSYQHAINVYKDLCINWR